MSSRQPLQSPSWSKAVMISAFIFSRCKSIRSSRLLRKLFVLDIMSSTNHSDGQLHISEQIHFVYLTYLPEKTQYQKWPLHSPISACMKDRVNYLYFFYLNLHFLFFSLWGPTISKVRFPLSDIRIWILRKPAIISRDRLISWNWTPPQCNRNSPTSLFNQMLNSAVLRFPETKDCVQISWN